MAGHSVPTLGAGAGLTSTTMIGSALAMRVGGATAETYSLFSLPLNQITQLTQHAVDYTRIVRLRASAARILRAASAGLRSTAGDRAAEVTAALIARKDMSAHGWRRHF